MKTCAILMAIGMVPAGTVLSSEFATGFGNDYNHAGQVTGQNEWNIDDPTPDLSFFVRLNGSDAAAIGGFYDAPAHTSARLYHPVGVPFAGSSFRVSVAIIPSTALFPGRDTFGWSLMDSSGASLFRLHFIPAANGHDVFNMLWSTGTGVPVNTGRAISSLAPYKVDLKFTSSGAQGVGFSAVISGAGSFSFSGSLPGLDGRMWQSVGADFIAGTGGYGDNYMIFDDLAAATLPVADADSDGWSAAAEAWFGSSDSSGRSVPEPELSLVSGTPSLTFPSVPGNTYLIEVSDDLTAWTAAATVAATGSTTLWLDSTPLSGQRFYRVGKPL